MNEDEVEETVESVTRVNPSLHLAGNADGIVVKINPSAKEVEEYLMAQQNK